MVKYYGEGKEVTVPEGITEIGNEAFNNCKTIERVILPNTLKKIEAYAFRAVKSVDCVIPAGVQSISEGAFAGCDIFAISTEQGSPFCVADGCLIDTVSKKLIAGCPKSKIPEDGTVTSIAAYAFYGYCFDDEEFVTIPLAVKTIEEYAFCDCENLTIHCKVDKYDKPEGWAEQWYEHPEPWDDGWQEHDAPIVEWGCMSLKERAEKDRIIREREEAAERFSQSQLNDYVRENGIMTNYVGEGGEIFIPPDVKIIRKHCFDDCDNVTSVKIHYFVEYIEDCAFDKFRETDVQFYFQAEKSPQGFKNNRFKHNNLHFGCMTDDEREQVEKELSIRKSEELALRGFEVQGEYLCGYNGSDEYIVLPYNDVTTVDRKAFLGNTKIKLVHFGSVNEIWDDAFRDCANLKKVILPDTVTKFDSSVFCNCENLNVERFPALTSKVYALAFSNTALEAINLNLDFVGNGAFSYCRRLKRAVINNEGNCELRWQAFFNCRSLEEVELNFNAHEIEWGMFEGCSSLRKVKLPGNLQIIGHSAFKDCVSLSGIEIPSTVTEIKSQAFVNCKALQNLTIPNSVTEIGDAAFLGCSGWTSSTTITLPQRFKKDIRRIFGESKDPFMFDDGPRFKFV